MSQNEGRGRPGHSLPDELILFDSTAEHRNPPARWRGRREETRGRLICRRTVSCICLSQAWNRSPASPRLPSFQLPLEKTTSSAPLRSVHSAKACPSLRGFIVQIRELRDGREGKAKERQTRREPGDLCEELVVSQQQQLSTLWLRRSPSLPPPLPSFVRSFSWLLVSLVSRC